MAKKKEAPASPFVPEEEQPYPIPENWRWVKLEFVCSGPITDGTHKTPKYCEKTNGVPFVSAKDVTSEYIDWSNVKYIVPDLHQELYKRLAPQKNDILLAKNGTTGVAALVETNDIFDLYVTIAVLRPNIGIILPKFMYRLINSPICKNQFNSHLTGIGVPNLHLRDIKNVSIPLPPLSEQSRIVDRIESLFAKLDEAKEKAQAVVDGFELRKSAILHKAFTGELTERWRKEHGVGMESWETSNLSDRFEIVGGVQKKPSRTPKDNPIPYLTVANVFRDRIDLSELRYFEVFDGELDKLRLQDKDILVVEGNGSGNEIGRCAMWHCELPICIHQNHIIRLRATDRETMPEYVLFFLNSSAGKSIMKERAKTTAGLFNLSTGKIKTIPVPFATIAEQKEIVRILDRFLTQEQQAKEAAEAVLSQIDTMKKAILARAFRGELGTNDPEEESTGELVAELNR